MTLRAFERVLNVKLVNRYLEIHGIRNKHQPEQLQLVQG